MASSIRAKLILGLLPGLIVLLVMAGVGLYTLDQIERTASQLDAHIQADIAIDGVVGEQEAAIHEELTQQVQTIQGIRTWAERSFLIILLVAVLGGAIFARAFSDHLAQPIRAIASQARRLAAGRPPEPLGARRSDELGDLVRAFDDMAASVEASSSSLRQLLADRSKELNALNQVSAIISASSDLDQALQQALETVLDVVNATQGGIWVTTDAGDLRLAASVNQPQAIVESEEQMQIGACLCGQAVEMGRTLLVNDLQAMPHMANSLCCQHGVRSLLTVPIQVYDRVVGMIRAANEAPRSLSMQDELFLAAAGRQIGIAIENERLNAAERQQRELADTLRSISQTLVSSLDLGDVLDAILEQIGHVLQVDAGLILLVQGDELEVAAVRGRPELDMERWRRYRFPAQDSVYFSQVLAEKQPLTFCDPYRTDLFERGIERIEDVQWCLVVPLLVDGR
ncbi:MAG: GAF domain-containing protein, partial [Caldilineae bacterium]